MYVLKNLIQKFKFLFCLFLISASTAQSTSLKISILQTAEHPALDATREGLLAELKTLGYNDLIVDYQSAQGNATLAVQIAQKFVSNKPDIIVAIATKASQAAMTATKGANIPLVFTSVTDPLAAKLVADLKSPQGYVTGVSNFVAPEPAFAFFKKVIPHLKTLGIIYDPGEPNSISLNKAMETAAKNMGLQLVMAPATKTSEVLTASKSLCGKVDAMFANNDNTALAAFKSVVKAAQGCNIPALVSDVDMMDQGAFAALGPNQFDLGRQTARMVDRILKNPEAPLPPVEFPEKTEEYVKDS